jgi:hypothetical protein
MKATVITPYGLVVVTMIYLSEICCFFITADNPEVSSNMGGGDNIVQWTLRNPAEQKKIAARV